VRQQQPCNTNTYVRSIGGGVLSSLVTETACIRIETIRCRSLGKGAIYTRMALAVLMASGIPP
jgi:hypothetical protein